MSDHNNDPRTHSRGPDWIMVVMGIALVAIVVTGYITSTKNPEPVASAAPPSTATTAPATTP